MQRFLAVNSGGGESKGKNLTYGVRGAPPQIRKRARGLGLEVLADATFPFVIQQEEATEELLREKYYSMFLRSRTHHDVPRLTGISQDVGGEICVVENEDKVEQFQPEWVQGVATVGVIGANETPDWMVDDAAKRIKTMAG
jgi:4-hydroxy-3-methylbut-2-enyl diphosphate reductase IspH